MADQVDVDETTRLTSLLERVAAGEEIVIARHGQPVARMVPEQRHPEGPRPLGAWAGLISVPDDINDGDDEIAAAILDEPIEPVQPR